MSSVAPADPPLYSDRCTKHARTAEPGNCGACADVRKANAQRPLSLVPADAAWPLHCGNCDENRHVKTERGMKRCPECHPLAEEAS